MTRLSKLTAVEICCFMIRCMTQNRLRRFGVIWRVLKLQMWLRHSWPRRSSSWWPVWLLELIFQTVFVPTHSFQWHHKSKAKVVIFFPAKKLSTKEINVWFCSIKPENLNCFYHSSAYPNLPFKAKISFHPHKAAQWKWGHWDIRWVRLLLSMAFGWLMR